MTKEKMINPSEYVINNSLRILVKPGKKRNCVLGYDYKKKALLIEVKAPPHNNEANKEVVRFLSKLLRRKIRIKSGHTAKLKTLVVH
ncbi:MAG TPA: DUF167 domain-containing protein [Candidatus Woesearchaeota archaeon]|nr:DUF167 domain-containing protein [Candidatus Woesearchaeota archaeon]